MAALRAMGEKKQFYGVYNINKYKYTCQLWRGTFMHKSMQIAVYD